VIERDDEKEAVRALLALIENRKPRPGIANTGPQDRGRSEFHRLFVAGVDALLLERNADGSEKYTLASLAEIADVNRTTVWNWYTHGMQKRTQIPGWALSVLPKPARTSVARALLESTEPPPPSRTGTDG
jgi:hypothetical protein